MKNYRTNLDNPKKRWWPVKNKQKKNNKRTSTGRQTQGRHCCQRNRKKHSWRRVQQHKIPGWTKGTRRQDRVVINDENASPSDREAAEGRVERREEEFARLKAQIEERKRARPLLERVIETPTAVFLTAGVIIGAVICAITNALKNTGKSLENCLGELCKKKKKKTKQQPSCQESSARWWVFVWKLPGRRYAFWPRTHGCWSCL